MVRYRYGHPKPILDVAHIGLLHTYTTYLIFVPRTFFSHSIYDPECTIEWTIIALNGPFLTLNVHVFSSVHVHVVQHKWAVCHF